VAQHYCDPDESFDPTPTFKKEKFSRVLKFWNWLTGYNEDWFSPISPFCGLGVNFAIIRARGPGGPGGGWVSDWAALVDLAAITTLCEVRTTVDLELLKQQLQIPIHEFDLEQNSIIWTS
jgi:hypothetical protein